MRCCENGRHARLRVGLFIRRHLQETEAFLEARGAAAVKQSFGTMLAAHVKEVLACMGIITSGTISFYVILLYMPTFARTQLHLPLDQAFVAQSISLACMIVLTPLSGALSDRIGRKHDYNRRSNSLFRPRISAI